MIDKIFAPLSILLFLVSVGYLAYTVGEVDLWIVIVFAAALVSYDFYLSLRHGDDEENGGSQL